MSYMALRDIKKSDVRTRANVEDTKILREFFHQCANSDGTLCVEEIKAILTEVAHDSPHDGLRAIALDTIHSILGDDPVTCDIFLERMRLQGFCRLFKEVSPFLCRKRELSCSVMQRLDHALSNLLTGFDSSSLLPVEYQGHTFSLHVPAGEGSGARRLRLQSTRARFERPGFGLVLEAGPPGLMPGDFEPGDLDHMRIEFGCVIIRGMKNPFPEKRGFQDMCSKFGFALPLMFGPLHVVKATQSRKRRGKHRSFGVSF